MIYLSLFLYSPLDNLMRQIGMASLDVRFQVSFLCESVLTEWTDKRPLPRVLFHVDLQ